MICVEQTHLIFRTSIGRQKPESIRNRQTPCPFCDRSQLAEILEEQGSILWVKNKYPVLQDSFQTVIIESAQCDGELSIYPKDHLYRLIRFGVERWLEWEESGRFRSVIFFKNHGPLSGGTIAHPHMQIIGLYHLDAYREIKEDDFDGLVIHDSSQAFFNVSTKPRAGFTEFNILLDDLAHLDRMADYIQIAAHYVLHHFPYPCRSYNLFFYRWGQGIAAKLIPRFVTSPLYIGYAIPQVPDDLEETVNRIRRFYFQAEKKWGAAF